MSESNQRQYTNGEITVVWQPEVCIHSKLCWKGLLNVFNPQKKPWVNMDGASTEEIRDQVSKCPSGALSYFDNGAQEVTTSIQSESIVEVVPDGPLLVYGHIQVKDASGHVTDKHKVTAFCRCGASTNKPYCDGTHRKIDFRG
jgi:uncharacterized Fe-S cluster protein YjdI